MTDTERTIWTMADNGSIRCRCKQCHNKVKLYDLRNISRIKECPKCGYSFAKPVLKLGEGIPTLEIWMIRAGTALKGESK